MNENQEANSNIPVQVRVSRLAITAISLALSGLLCILMLPLSIYSKLLFRFSSLFYYLSYILLVCAIILGIIGIIHINISGGRKTGHGFAFGAIIIPLVALFISWMFLPFLARIAFEKYRMTCGTHLSAIGKAMLIYANDFDEKLPRAGGEASTWGTSVKWDAETRQDAFGINSDGTGGTATISSSLFLLVKYDLVSSQMFICASDIKVSSFEPSSIGVTHSDMRKFWDFGLEPWKHCSYSYNMPYGDFPLTTSNDPGLAVASDRNPWIPSPGWKVKSFQKFNPDGTKEEKKAGNSPVHFNQGQHVLYLDTHVNFESISFCGVNEDNIYTSWNGSDIRKGTPPKVGSQPSNKLDSLLVNDPPIQKP